MPRYTWHFTCTACGFRYGWNGAAHQKPPCPKCLRAAERAAKPRQTEAVAVSSDRTLHVESPLADESIGEAIEWCEMILEMIDELPDRAADFGESCGETVRGIRESIEQHQKITDGQRTALENIQRGVSRWLDH